MRKELEAVYAKNGLTLADAINVFFQQSLNAGGFPFQVTEDNAEIVKAKAMTRLMKELKKGDDCTEVYSEEDSVKVSTGPAQRKKGCIKPPLQTTCFARLKHIQSELSNG